MKNKSEIRIQIRKMKCKRIEMRTLTKTKMHIKQKLYRQIDRQDTSQTLVYSYKDRNDQKD